jgi:hypothetical protein
MQNILYKWTKIKKMSSLKSKFKSILINVFQHIQFRTICMENYYFINYYNNIYIYIYIYVYIYIYIILLINNI